MFAHWHACRQTSDDIVSAKRTFLNVRSEPAARYRRQGVQTGV